jgi:hypothetical protein
MTLTTPEEASPRPNNPTVCQWVTRREALSAFVVAEDSVQGSRHIKPLHWYVACRLVIEGGFAPDSITPRPPFALDVRGSGSSRRLRLRHDVAGAGTGERTVLGGLKTKSVDVVVALNGIGPCIAISMKGTLNAFRNLTNRMEEAVGDCTNLHITYPALVYGFLHVLRANREGLVPANGKFLKPDERGNVSTADIAMRATGETSEQIRRYHDALSGLANRRHIRDDVTRYEAVALTLVSPELPTLGDVIATYPRESSPLLIGDFFKRVYDQFDERFVYGAPDLSATTRRLEWDDASPALADPRSREYTPRVGA